MVCYVQAMGDAWFRRWMGFGFIPIRWQGWAAVVATVVVFLPCAYLWVNYIDQSPFIAWGGAIVGMLVTAAYHALALWKLERTYRR